MTRQGDLFLSQMPSGGRRPVVVVSRDALNRGAYVVVVPFSTARLRDRHALPNCVIFRAGEFGLTEDCVAQGESIAAIPVRFLDPFPIGRLDNESFRNVIQAIGNVLGSDCEPVD